VARTELLKFYDINFEIQFWCNITDCKGIKIYFLKYVLSFFFLYFRFSSASNSEMTILNNVVAVAHK